MGSPQTMQEFFNGSQNKNTLKNTNIFMQEKKIDHFQINTSYLGITSFKNKLGPIDAEFCGII